MSIDENRVSVDAPVHSLSGHLKNLRKTLKNLWEHFMKCYRNLG